MCRLFGSHQSVTSFDRTIRVLAFSALALALGLALSACGRRGPLDPPPGAVMTSQGPAQLDAEGKLVAPPGERKRLPIDWLLD
jgi:predicted small lipoprotein YifL